MREAKTTRPPTQALLLALFGAVLFVLGLQACTAGRPNAADGTGSYVALMEGPCTTDGQKRACHVETGRVQGIVNCFSGEQTCTGGSWGPCGGEGTIASLNLDVIEANGREGASTKSSTSGLRLLTVTASDASYDNPSCKSNPCNPYCVGIEVDADKMVPDGGFAEYVTSGTVAGPDTFPGGLTGPKNAMGTFSTSSPASVACSPGTPPADGKVCASDYCCAAYPVGTSPNTCQPWAAVGKTNPVAEEKCVKATGVDFTLGLACNDANGDVHVPLCNRGTADATSGTVMVAEYPGNPEYSGDLGGGGTDFCNNAGDPSAYCLVDVANKKIAAGKCIDVNVTAKTAAGTTAGVTCPKPTFSSGNRTMMVNPVAQPAHSWAKTFSPAYATVPEADHCNNYSFHPSTAQGGTCSAYGEQPPPPQNVCFTYEALCNPGFRIVWNQLAYATTVPSESQVLFSVMAAPTVDGGLGTFTTKVLAADIRSTSSPDPAICAMSGSPDANACPKNLAALLGETASHYETLAVCVTQIAVTALPIVNGWQVTFNCVPYE